MTTSSSKFRFADDTTTIVWDLDGTLIDSVRTMGEVLAVVLQSFDYPMPTDQKIRANFHGSLRDSLGGMLDIDGEALDLVLANFLVEQDKIYADVTSHLIPDAIDLARRAHRAGYRQILVTNREHVGRDKGSPRSIVENSELGTYIDHVVCGDDSEHRKPKPAVLGELLFHPETSIVIGDQFVDAEFGYNLGCPAVIVHRGASVPMHFEKLTDEVRANATIVTSLTDVIA